jgi:hypothetical protein
LFGFLEWIHSKEPGGADGVTEQASLRAAGLSNDWFYTRSKKSGSSNKDLLLDQLEGRAHPSLAPTRKRGTREARGLKPLKELIGSCGCVRECSLQPSLPMLEHYNSRFECSSCDAEELDVIANFLGDVLRDGLMMYCYGFIHDLFGASPARTRRVMRALSAAYFDGTGYVNLTHGMKVWRETHPPTNKVSEEVQVPWRVACARASRVARTRRAATDPVSQASITEHILDFTREDPEVHGKLPIRVAIDVAQRSNRGLRRGCAHVRERAVGKSGGRSSTLCRPVTVAGTIWSPVKV